MSILPTPQSPPLKAPETEFDRFVYTISHDLQEPLRLISSFVKLLNTKCASSIPEECQEYLEYITDNTDHMKSMIYSLVDYSRVDRNQEPKEKINLNELVSDILTMYGPEMTVCNATIEMDELPMVVGQPSLIISLLKHLFQNAFEACQDEALHITFTHKSDGDFWEFCLEDNGSGIRIEPVDRAFEMFRKMDRPEQNLGAGLAICSAIVRKHGGKMFVQSVPMKGTKMYFTLPK